MSRERMESKKFIVIRETRISPLMWTCWMCGECCWREWICVQYVGWRNEPTYPALPDSSGLITVSAILCVLCVMCGKREKERNNQIFLEINKTFKWRRIERLKRSSRKMLGLSAFDERLDPAKIDGMYDGREVFPGSLRTQNRPVLCLE